MFADINKYLFEREGVDLSRLYIDGTKIEANANKYTYGSYNNYLFCAANGMEKYMKFTMFEKETKDIKYRDDPYRSVNFKRNENGFLLCPEGRKFEHLYDRHIKGNQYGRTRRYTNANADSGIKILLYNDVAACEKCNSVTGLVVLRFF